MNIHVNIIAGEILLLLEEKRRQISLVEVQYSLGQSMSLINLAVGRLLREDLIDMETRSNNNCISKKSNDESGESKDFLSQSENPGFSAPDC